MVEKLFRLIFTVIGLFLGFFTIDAVIKLDSVVSMFPLVKEPVWAVIFYTLFTIILGLILFIISPILYLGIAKLIDSIESSIQKLTASEIIFGAIGAIISLIIASLFMVPLNRVLNKINDIIGPVIFILINLIAGIIGADISVKKKDDILSIFGGLKKGSSREKKNKQNIKVFSKVLDTSVIIDGRIFDLCQTGFIEGPLVIANFVLDELRHISDSSDTLKRNRGRRGLDILNRIQKELNIEVQNWEGDFPEISEVDSKLLKLAQILGGKVITNDYNLNKVAEFQGVPVLNINELANAIKPVVLPGEDMKLTIVKDGKEANQGIAYLDDGTMIVVEGGRKFIGEEIAVTVTSVLQTAAGRMIFAKQKEG